MGRRGKDSRDDQQRCKRRTAVLAIYHSLTIVATVSAIGIATIGIAAIGIAAVSTVATGQAGSNRSGKHRRLHIVFAFPDTCCCTRISTLPGTACSATAPSCRRRSRRPQLRAQPAPARLTRSKRIHLHQWLPPAPPPTAPPALSAPPAPPHQLLKHCWLKPPPAPPPMPPSIWRSWACDMPPARPPAPAPPSWPCRWDRARLLQILPQCLGLIFGRVWVVLEAPEKVPALAVLRQLQEPHDFLLAPGVDLREGPLVREDHHVGLDRTGLAVRPLQMDHAVRTGGRDGQRTLLVRRRGHNEALRPVVLRLLREHALAALERERRGRGRRTPIRKEGHLFCRVFFFEIQRGCGVPTSQ